MNIQSFPPKRKLAVFLINLLQDVNIVRPLVYMAARDLGLETRFLISQKFLHRDQASIWRQELNEISAATATKQMFYDAPSDALVHLNGRSGVLIAASESNLRAHFTTSDVFRLAPSSYVRVTLQHGLECVGFLQSHQHDLAHGRSVTFNADIVCGWLDAKRLTSMQPSQWPKLCVTGPTAVLQMAYNQPGAHETVEAEWEDRGLVCENLHSTRFSASGDFKSDFMTTFNAFCDALALESRSVTLRPHPGGQYVIKNNIPLPRNAELNNNPMYKVDLSRYAYGISAPSSVVIDMVLAGIPTAVWRDENDVIDTTNFQGLTEIRTLEDWIEFSREAVANPQPFIERQQAFLAAKAMPTDPADVYRRYANMLQAATRSGVGDDAERPRILFVANSIVPTLQLSLLKPLKELVDTDQVDIEILVSNTIRDAGFDYSVTPASRSWVRNYFDAVRPTVVVFCRYSDEQAEPIVSLARERSIPVILHIDDDLLNIPEEVGLDKQKYHNQPERVGTVRYLLDNVDLIYCSTQGLEERFRSIGVTTPIYAGKIYCSGQVMASPSERPVRKVGYMGFGHAHDLSTILPALVEFMKRNPDVIFELFGSIPTPSKLQKFGKRVIQSPPIKNYNDFMTEFVKREWDIGICPLAMTPFNLVKANTKWVEYTSVGTAVIASRNTVYDDCCADGCGILADGNEEWLEALELLTHDPAARAAQVARAQAKVSEFYTVEKLRQQVLDVLDDAAAIVASRNAS